MADLIFVAIVIAFFALTVAFVRACDAIIGPDPSGLDEAATPASEPATGETVRESAR